MQKKNQTEQKEHGSEFFCQQCGKYHFQSVEAAFQRATGYDFTWRCDCGHEIQLVGITKEHQLTPEQFLQVQRQMMDTRIAVQEKMLNDLLLTVSQQCESVSGDLKILHAMKSEMKNNQLVQNSDALWHLWEKYRMDLIQSTQKE